ncbi:MAG: TonB-dependent receptor [Sphingomonadales bacterium]|nr:MAG: TonB-dependent receptor [Sphingomonadales bacterium]
MNSSNSRSLRRAALLASGALFAFATPVFAQDAVPAAQDSAIAADENEGEIVVTAQKRSERLQDVPASVAVVSAEKLTAQGITKFEDYANRVPGMSLTSGRPGLTQVALRGITTGPAQSAAATGFYVGEAPIGSVNAYSGGSNTTLDLDPSDLTQIEVLKGPQGTLYGANAMGGLVKYVTAEPNYNEITGRVSAAVNSVNQGGTGYGFRGAINVPIISDTLAVRASAYKRRDAGYIDIVGGLAQGKDVNYVEVTGGRVMLGAKLGSDVEIQLQAIAQDTETGGSNGIDVDATTLRPISGDLKAVRQVREPGKVQFRLYNGVIKADLGGFDLVSSTTYQIAKAYTHGDSTIAFGPTIGLFSFGSGPVAVQSNQETRIARFSQEVRATSAGLLGGALDVQLGAYYTHEDGANRIPYFGTFSLTTGATLTPATPFVAAEIVSTYKEYSAFANATVHFGERFDVLVGGRYSHADQTYDHRYSGTLILLTTGAATNTSHGEDSASIFTFLVSPRFKISDNAMVYGRVSSGYRPGGPNALAPGAPTTFDADRLTSYEAGLKLTAADGKLGIDLAAFYTNWKDVQAQTSAGGFNYIVNGGDALSQGAEATIRYNPMRGLSFGMNVAYTDAHLTENAPAAGGLDGDRLPFVPDWSGSLYAQYNWSLGDNLDATLGGSVNHTGQRVSNYSTKAPKPVDDYTTINLNAGLDFKGWSLSLFAKNLTDERGVLALASQTNTPGGNPFAKAVTTPRTIGAEVAVRF